MTMWGKTLQADGSSCTNALKKKVPLVHSRHDNKPVAWSESGGQREWEKTILALEEELVHVGIQAIEFH